jgi:hypothetical protein
MRLDSFQREPRRTVALSMSALSLRRMCHANSGSKDRTLTLVVRHSRGAHAHESVGAVTFPARPQRDPNRGAFRCRITLFARPSPIPAGGTVKITAACCGPHSLLNHSGERSTVW